MIEGRKERKKGRKKERKKERKIVYFLNTAFKTTWIIGE
jgi:hypothetical protein